MDHKENTKLTIYCKDNITFSFKAASVIENFKINNYIYIKYKCSDGVYYYKVSLLKGEIEKLKITDELRKELKPYERKKPTKHLKSIRERKEELIQYLNEENERNRVKYRG